MISFLLEEGVLTVGTLSGLFTTALLNSLKANIVDPSIENIFPSHHLEPTTPPPPPPPPPSPPPQLKPQTNQANQTKSGFGDLFANRTKLLSFRKYRNSIALVFDFGFVSFRKKASTHDSSFKSGSKSFWISIDNFGILLMDKK